ncbi:MAG TPA: hypothetical protein VMW40_02515 [Candidatus Bathyarchaeia archaeon]|nr:hypothetical protein [Candidatus Bathyarchaeia archaeon]
MYPYDYANAPISMDPYKIFVAMPFKDKYDDVFNVLISGAISKLNEILGRQEPERYHPIRTKDEPTTTEGWNEILKHILSSRMIIGVLDENNPNVFYELGIAHATQPLSKQVLMASYRYKSNFDTKDLIHFRYHRENLSGDIDRFASWMKNSFKKYEIEQERRVKKARMRLGVKEFSVINLYGSRSHFILPEKGELQKIPYELALRHLCEDGLLGLNTESMNSSKYSYYWTNFGNEVLDFLGRITKEERKKRFSKLPDGFK